MKHIYSILLTIILFVFQLLVTLIGMVILPFFLTRIEPFACEHKESLPNVKFKDMFIDLIFGNREDGLDGDAPYKAKYSNKLNLWTRYNWVAIRNPIHNLALYMGVNEIITNYNWVGNRYTEDRVGKEGFVYSEAVGQSGKVYPMYRWCKILFAQRGIELNIGYKNFNIQEVNQHYKYSFTVSFNPIKKFEPARNE